MGRTLKKFFIVAGFVVVLIGGFALWLSDKYVVPIMMYHRVNTVALPDTVMVSPESFRRHMKFLKQNYHVISMDELVQGIKERKRFPRNSVVITFDDGYDDNYQTAFPILKEYDLAAIFFVPPANVGKEHHLTWPQIKEMLGSGQMIGSHTYNETYLPSLSLEEQKKSINESKKLLEAQLGQKIDYFSYPVGGFSEEIKKMVQDAGFKGACTTNRGKIRFNKDMYELKRIRFGDSDNSEMILRIKLSGYYNLFRKSRNPS